MAQPYYHSGVNENLDGEMYFSQQDDRSTKPSETLPGVYDLAGENVQGVYDLSTPSKPKLPSKGSKPTTGTKTSNKAYKRNGIRDPSEIKHWMLMHRRMLLAILLVVVCVAFAIGIPIGLLNEKGRETKGSDQNATEYQQGKRNMKRYYLWNNQN